MIDADHFRERVAQDAIAEATAEYWERRAKAFRAVGTATADEAAQSCVNRAALARAEWAEHSPPDRIVCAACGTPTSPWSCSCGGTRVPELSEVDL